MTLPAVLPPGAPGLVPAVAVGGPVTLKDELALWQEAFEFAKAIAPTPFVPKDLRNNPPAVMACIIKGHELGVSALHSLASIHIIEGRPCLAAELQRALILARDHDVWVEESTITRVVLCGRRKGADHVARVTWTIEDAKRAGLAGKSNWRNYPRQMLLARASGELARIMFADVLAGMSYNVEELTDGIDVLELTEGEAAETKPAAKPKRTRRTTKASAAVAARPAAVEGPQERPPAPGGPPPSLPGEEGYEVVGESSAMGETDSDRPTDRAGPRRHGSPTPGPETESAPQEPQDESRPQPPTETAERPGDAESAPDPDQPVSQPGQQSEPEAVVTKRAQAIAMQARDANVDHHHVVEAVTHGAKSSAKDLTAPEADAVLHALADLRAGRAELILDDNEWQVVETSKVEAYQRRVRDLREQQQAQRRGGQQALPTEDE